MRISIQCSLYWRLLELGIAIMVTKPIVLRKHLREHWYQSSPALSYLFRSIRSAMGGSKVLCTCTWAHL
ncbi:hypothetical protein BDR04DRAFT_327771 [Suillus decipiens]|nr:hypothetical protein BDR04DRAFT_327771 [Suillus decipiens]